jgi:hypothetical protein
MPLQVMFQDAKMIPLASLSPHKCNGTVTLLRNLLNCSTQIKLKRTKKWGFGDGSGGVTVGD